MWLLILIETEFKDGGSPGSCIKTFGKRTMSQPTITSPPPREFSLWVLPQGWPASAPLTIHLLTFITCNWVTDVWPGQVKRVWTRQVTPDTVIIINTSGIPVCFSGWPHNCARSDRVLHLTLPGQSRVQRVRTHLHSSAGSRFADSRPGCTVFLSHNPCLLCTRCYRWLMSGNMWLKALLLQSQNKYFKCLYNIIQNPSIP